MNREELEAKELVNRLSSFVNCMAGVPGKNQFISELTLATHRTLQASIFGLMLDCIEAWSKLDHRYIDARNEAVKKMALQITELIGPARPPCI